MSEIHVTPPEASTPDASNPESTAAAPSPSAGVHRALRRFQGTLDAIRQVEERITPLAGELDKERFSPQALAAVEQLSPRHRQELEAWIGQHAGNSEVVDADTEPIADGEAIESDPPRDIVPPPSPATVRAPPLILRTVVGVNLFGDHLIRSAISPARENLLRSSLLVTAFGALEVLIGVLAREFYLAHPGALGDEPKFTLKELQQFDNLDEARTAAVASQVDKVLQGDLAEWEKWFESRLNLSLDSYCIDRSKLEEMFQRRHVIVHNDSQVSRLYLRRLSGRTDLPELDQILPVPRPYLDEALDALDVLGSLLAFNTWRKLFSSEETKGTEDITRRSYSLMLRGRWAAARTICQACVDASPKAEHREIFRANQWLAEKRLGNLADVCDEIDIWDVSALHPRFTLVRHALLDDIDAAIPLADRLLGQGVIAVGSVEDWPVLQELRKDPRYPAMIENHTPVSNDASG